MKQRKKLRALVTGAVMVALAFVLSYVKIKMPGWSYGGSVTLGSMVPLAIYGMLYGTGWGLSASLVYALLQMMSGFYPPPAGTVWAYFLAVTLDYLLAFGFLGLGGAFRNLYLRIGAGKTISAGMAAASVVFLRFLCHFASGIVIWQEYAPTGTPVWLYSLLYNGGYMAGEMILTFLITMAIFPPLSRRFPELFGGKKNTTGK